ncbi:cell division protein FtsZ [Aquincola sp. MAHUQ-54]|uniref:Cell division protein FtsZ n=1 Tax=Aquincola agrisoli TaxID=3119538 RepID=A0AAW9QDL8_9BURK
MTLTVALAILAGIVIAALVVHSIWTARRAGPRRADGELPAHRVEPGLDAISASADDGTKEPSSGASDPADEPHPALRPPPPAARRPARLDPLIDAIAPLALDAPISGDMVLAHMPPSRRAGTKPFHIEGLNVETGDWEAPMPGRRYGELQAGVQLANRSGALNQIEYSEFVQKVQAFAEAVGAMPDFPDMLDVAARARELDGFASPHDAQLSMLLRANSAAWSVGFIQQSAARQGFVPGALPGRLVLPAPDEGAPPVLVLSFDPQAALAEDPAAAALREVTLSLDVPQTPETAEPFAAWQEAARALAASMDSTLVDDRGWPITLQHFTGIAADLQVLYRTLESRDLAAGSPAARRLFS